MRFLAGVASVRQFHVEGFVNQPVLRRDGLAMEGKPLEVYSTNRFKRVGR